MSAFRFYGTALLPLLMGIGYVVRVKPCHKPPRSDDLADVTVDKQGKNNYFEVEINQHGSHLKSGADHDRVDSG